MLFFVSVGMLFDPMIVVRDPAALLATLLIIVLGKSVAAFAIVRAFGHPASHALTISASLAQIGEFSFILAALGVELGLLPAAGTRLILAGAIISILINPGAVRRLYRVLARREAAAKGAKVPQAPEPPAREPIARPGSATTWCSSGRSRRTHRGGRRQDPAGAAASYRERRWQRGEIDGE